MLPNRTLQLELKKLGFYEGSIDGILGIKTKYAAQQFILIYNKKAAQWNDKRILIAANQAILYRMGYDVGEIDGLFGPQTEYALEQWQNQVRDLTPPQKEIEHQPIIFPRQKDVPKFYGEMGKNLNKLELPYPMKLAWDKNTVVTSVTLHKKVIPSAEIAFKEILNHYGEHMITLLGLDIFGGSFNIRKMRGGNQYSMHSWGIAIDFDPENNKLRWGKDKAKLAGEDYIAFWNIWEAQGWISLGRERNYDWMHIQAARL
jgi:hypothetical protein